MFSQEEINDWVSFDLVLTFVVIAALAVFFIYKWIDYKIFLHKIHKSHKNRWRPMRCKILGKWLWGMCKMAKKKAK